MHCQSIPYCSVCLSQYSTHKANLAHEDFCVAFHIGEKGLLAENVCIIRDNTKKVMEGKKQHSLTTLMVFPSKAGTKGRTECKRDAHLSIGKW